MIKLVNKTKNCETVLFLMRHPYIINKGLYRRMEE